MVSPFYERIFHPFRPKMKCGRYKACQMGKHLTGTTNSMWHWSFDLVVGQSYIRKIFLKFLFYCTRIMINILIIFLTQYFFYKNDLLIRISPCNQKVQGSIFVSKKNCVFMNEMDEKKTVFQKLFQVRCPETFFEEKRIKFS